MAEKTLQPRFNWYVSNKVYLYMDYRKEQNGDLITLWDDTEGIGLQFKQGETLQRYTSSVVMKDTAILSTEEGVAHLSEVEKALTAFAEAHYPKEFEPLKEEEA